MERENRGTNSIKPNEMTYSKINIQDIGNSIIIEAVKDWRYLRQIIEINKEKKTGEVKRNA